MTQMSIISIPGFSEPIACFSHLLASVGYFFLAIILMIKGRGNCLRVSSLLIYCICALYLFSMSGVYHLLEPGGMPRSVFQRLDHSGIWAMIAGTFTPIHIILFRRIGRWGVLLIVWVVAITGLTLEVVFFKDFPEWLSLLLYLTLGWLGLATYLLYKKTHNEVIVRYLVLGGLSYSFGAVFEFLRWPVLIRGVLGPHEVFHFFVILGAFFHGKFIYLISDICIKKKLTFIVKVRGSDEFYVVAKGENISFKTDSRKGICDNISALVSQKYSPAYLPPVVRLQYIQEEYVQPHDTTNKEVSGDLFHQI